MARLPTRGNGGNKSLIGHTKHLAVCSEYLIFIPATGLKMRHSHADLFRLEHKTPKCKNPGLFSVKHRVRRRQPQRSNLENGHCRLHIVRQWLEERVILIHILLPIIDMSQLLAGATREAMGCLGKRHSMCLPLPTMPPVHVYFRVRTRTSIFAVSEKPHWFQHSITNFQFWLEMSLGRNRL